MATYTTDDSGMATRTTTAASIARAAAMAAGHPQSIIDAAGVAAGKAAWGQIRNLYHSTYAKSIAANPTLPQDIAQLEAIDAGHAATAILLNQEIDTARYAAMGTNYTPDGAGAPGAGAKRKGSVPAVTTTPEQVSALRPLALDLVPDDTQSDITGMATPQLGEYLAVLDGQLATDTASLISDYGGQIIAYARTQAGLALAGVKLAADKAGRLITMVDPDDADMLALASLKNDLAMAKVTTAQSHYDSLPDMPMVIPDSLPVRRTMCTIALVRLALDTRASQEPQSPQEPAPSQEPAPQEPQSPQEPAPSQEPAPQESQGKGKGKSQVAA